MIFDGSKRRLETLFGDRKIVEIEFERSPDFKAYARLGRVMKVEGSYLKMEVDPRMLTNRAFTRLLSKGDVADYKVGERGLSEILMRLYKVRRARGSKNGRIAWQTLRDSSPYSSWVSRARWRTRPTTLRTSSSG